MPSPLSISGKFGDMADQSASPGDFKSSCGALQFFLSDLKVAEDSTNS